MDYLEGLFGEATFNKSWVTSMDVSCLKYAQDMYRVHLKKIPRYECPPIILEKEWKALIEDAKEKKMRKEGKSPPIQTR